MHCSLQDASLHCQLTEYGVIATSPSPAPQEVPDHDLWSPAAVSDLSNETKELRVLGMQPSCHFFIRIPTHMY